MPGNRAVETPSPKSIGAHAKANPARAREPRDADHNGRREVDPASSNRILVENFRR
jgi:hypothetical protein